MLVTEGLNCVGLKDGHADVGRLVIVVENVSQWVSDMCSETSLVH